MALRCFLPNPSPRVVSARTEADLDSELSIQETLLIQQVKSFFPMQSVVQYLRRQIRLEEILFRTKYLILIYIIQLLWTVKTKINVLDDVNELPMVKLKSEFRVMPKMFDVFALYLLEYQRAFESIDLGLCWQYEETYVEASWQIEECHLRIKESKRRGVV